MLSVDSRSQDARAHDGQSAAGALTDEHHRPSQDGHQLVLGQHAAADVAAEDDLAADEDGEIFMLSKK